MKRIQDKFRIFLTLGLMLSGALFINAQTSVSGTVVDEGGLPLPGANVLVSGTSEGTVTEVDGTFSITTRTATPFNLEVSFTGFQDQSVAISGNRSDLTITLAQSATLIDEIVVSASRRREKVQEAPASISVLGARQLKGSPQVNPVRNLITVPGVQLQQQSASRINITMRGAAGIFGTSAFPIQDYRSLVGPGIGTFDALNSPINNLDLERIEVVRGPGSALYGPGVTTGVIHFITKNPIDNPGTAIELMGGELSTFGFSVRHAGANEDKTFGYKINASYRTGDEFTLDPVEDSTQVARFRTSIGQPAVTDGVVDATLPSKELLSESDLDPDGDGNMMQNDFMTASASATLEFRPSSDMSIVATGGWNTASAVFYNSQGEGLSQANEMYGQLRFQKGGLFAQAFFVNNDGGKEDRPTFLYQTGNRTPVARKQLEGQVQYNWDLDFLKSNWTAGIDYRQSISDTENLVYGRNEDDDDYSIYGGYLQGKFALLDQLDLVLAGRYDRFNFLDDGAFSPRAALVYKLDPKHTFRGSYNRANTTPTALQINIDFPVATVVPGAYDVWLFGNKEEQTFGDNPQIVWPGNLPFPSVPVGTPGFPTAYAYLAVNDLVVPQLLAGLEAANPALVPLLPVIEGILRDPANLPQGVSGTLTGHNIFSGEPLGLINAPETRIQTEDSYEFGYKGLFADKLGVTVDVWTRKIKNATLFTAISPGYMLNGADFGADLGAHAAGLMEQLRPILEAQMLPPALIDQILAGVSGGALAAYTAGGQGFQSNIAPFLPGGAFPFIGTTPTLNVPDNGVTHIAAGYRTFEEISYWGMDFGLEFYINSDLSAYANYSWLSDTEFETPVVGAEDLPPVASSLGVPKNKYRVGLIYAPVKGGIRGNISFQHDDSFDADFGQFSGETGDRNLVDFGAGYEFDFGLSIDLMVTNLLNNEYRAFANMPKIGRRGLIKIGYAF